MVYPEATSSLPGLGQWFMTAAAGSMMIKELWSGVVQLVTSL
jgi:hypothetical protein